MGAASFARRRIDGAAAWQRLWHALRAPAGALAWAWLGLTLICVVVPWAAAMPVPHLDSAWQFGINVAAARGLVFGRDIVFTYGPYATVLWGMFQPELYGRHLAAALLLAVTYVLALRLAWPQASRARVLAFALLAALMLLAREALLQTYPVVVALAVQRVLADKARTRVGALALAMVAAPFGLLLLVKGSFGILGAGVVALGVAALLVRQRWRHALALLLAPVVATALLWAWIGQPLAALPEFLRMLVPIVSGYTEAMSINGLIGHLIGYLIAALGMLVWLARQGTGRPVQRAFMLAVFALHLFLVWKGAFVRHDGHALLAAYALPLAWLLLPAPAPTFAARLAWARGARIALLASALLWVTVVHHVLHPAVLPVVWQPLIDTYVGSITDALRRVQDPHALAERFHGQLISIRRVLGLPPVQGAADIYGVRQTALLASALEWSPRPVFQSYSAYTERLAELNRQHLLGARAPQHVFFSLDPIDGRLPALEDGPSWPELLLRYRPTALLGPRLQLQRLGDAAARAPVFAPATRIEGRLGERLELPAGGGIRFARLDVQPTPLGRLASVLFKPPELYITTELAGGSRTWRFVPGMARAGFVISPRVASLSEFARLYGAPEAYERQRVQAVTVSGRPGGLPVHWAWRTRIVLDVTTLAPPAPPIDTANLPQAAPRFALPEGVTKVQSGSCHGSFDRMDRQAGPEGNPAHERIVVEGWAFEPDAPRAAQQVYLVTEEEGQLPRLVPTQPVERPDVVDRFSRADALHAGFRTETPVRAAALVTLSVAIRDGTRLRHCAGPSATLLGNAR